MNPNAIYDAKTKTVLLQFTYIQCDLDCKPPYSDCCSQQYLGHEAPSLFQISSADGLSWSRCTSFCFTHAMVRCRLSTGCWFTTCVQPAIAR